MLRTKVDVFALPPSGDLYSYPSDFPADEQAAFVKDTEEDARLLATSVSTTWEWAGSWERAILEYYPRFGTAGVVTSLVGVNVPYNIPTLAFGDKHYKVVGKKSVLFKPHEWRGTRGGGKIPWADQENLTADQMAAQVSFKSNY